MAGFVELSPKYKWRENDLWSALSTVVGVTDLKWQSTKTSQGNEGNHWAERNILVWSGTGEPGSASSKKPLEFEVTRHGHMADRNAPFTVTVCFKTPPPDSVAEAWRILMAVTAGKELFPSVAKKYMEKKLAKWRGDSVPGSASAAIPVAPEEESAPAAEDKDVASASVPAPAVEQVR